MTSTTQNPLNAHLFEVPDPPEEFGQDGGKFYRCYDALANEIDDDMVTGLKEQLDGMLIFAGLFAGVNTAFLALTLPLLSADPADDTNALLSLNNAILIQLVAGRNDSIPIRSPLPSASFSPSPDIFIINALFALSLAFAIISSFLAVLGRQWLVYYRKRSGGGPDHQRWEQLKRFLGAERWRLQAILDDVLPSLLQIGLIIFCVSLILYLRHLNQAISLIVAIPMYVGLAFFVGSALCTVWDKFCPFHSPLSHMLLGVRSAITIAKATKGFKWQDLISAVTNKQWVHSLIHGRGEESLKSLQTITLKRAICTSDDPATLLYATSNILGITDVTQMEQLWSDGTFQERFLDQYETSYTRMLQLRGRDQVGIAVAARRLYCGAAAHIMLVLDSNRRNSSSGEEQTTKGAFPSISSKEISDSPTYLVRATLRFPILQFDRSNPPDEMVKNIGVHLLPSSGAGAPPNWKLFSVITWVAINLHMIANLKHTLREPAQRTFRSDDVESMIQTLGEALKALIGPERKLVDCDGVLTNMLYAIRQIVVDQAQSNITLRHKFALLEICEPVLHSPRLPETARQVIRKIRRDLGRVWQQEIMLRARDYIIPTWLVAMLEQYLEKIGIIYPPDLGYHEYLEVLQAFNSPIRKLFSYSPRYWASRSGFKTRVAFREAFNTFVLHIDNMARQAQKNVLPSARVPEERWCHWQEETLSVRAIYSLPADPSDSWWHGIQELPEIGSPYTSPTSFSSVSGHLEKLLG